MMKIHEMGSRMMREMLRKLQGMEDVSGGEFCRRAALLCLLRYGELKAVKRFS